MRSYNRKTNIKEGRLSDPRQQEIREPTYRSFSNNALLPQEKNKKPSLGQSPLFLSINTEASCAVQGMSDGGRMTKTQAEFHKREREYCSCSEELRACLFGGDARRRFGAQALFRNVLATALIPVWLRGRGVWERERKIEREKERVLRSASLVIYYMVSPTPLLGCVDI